MRRAWDKSSLRKLRNHLSQHGYYLSRTKGSHFIYVNQEIGKEITVNKNLNKMVERRIRKEAGL